MVVVDRDAEGVVIDRTFSSMEGGGHAAFRFEARRSLHGNWLETWRACRARLPISRMSG